MLRTTNKIVRERLASHVLEQFEERARDELGDNYLKNRNIHNEAVRLLREQIRAYHLKQRNGYGERIAARRLEYLRGELRGERISYGELAELQGLADYIADDDVELLEPAGVPEGSR